MHLPALSADGPPWIDSSCQTVVHGKRNTVSRQAAETQRGTSCCRSLRLRGLARNNAFKTGIRPLTRRSQNEPHARHVRRPPKLTCKTESTRPEFANPSRPFQLSFPLSFQPFPAPRTEIPSPPMLPSNRRHAVPTPTPRPSRRNCPVDPPNCVTKFPAIPATQTRQATYPHTSNTLDSRELRHNAPPRSALS